VWHAVRDGEVPAQDLVRLAETVLPGEPQIGLVADVLGWVWQAVDQYLDPGLRQAALDRLQTACLGVITPLIRPTDPASTRAPAAAGRQLTFLRGAVRFTTAGSAPLIRSWLDLDVTPTGVPVDTEVRWDIWYRLSGLGLASPQEIDEAYERDRSAAGAEHAARCRAARPDPQAKATAWDSIVNDRSESSRLIMATAAAFWQAGQDYVAAEYVDRYARDVATMARGRNSWVTWELARFAFPRFAASSEAFARLHDLFAADHLPLPVRRAVTDGMDDLRRSIAARTCSGTWRDSLPAVSETAASAGRAAE
jgi:aminopeptidase N